MLVTTYLFMGIPFLMDLQLLKIRLNLKKMFLLMEL